MTCWNRRLLAGAIAALVPVLAGCEAGLDAPTLAYHPASSGVTVVQHGISIDNAFVLGSEFGSALPAGGQAGLFLALQARDGDRLVSVTAQGTAASVQLPGGSVDLPALTLVNLGGPVPKVVLTGLTNPLSGGQTIRLVLTFAKAAPITVDVPVEPRSYDYATYSPPATPTPSPTATAKARRSANPSGSPSASGSASPSATP